MDSQQSITKEVVDSFKGNPIATTIITLLIPALLVLAVIRLILTLFRDFFNLALDCYCFISIRLVHILLKMKKFDRKKGG